MEYLDSLFNKACERCEEHSTNGMCECMMTCPVYGLYVEAKKKVKTVVVNEYSWETPPPPKPEMI